MWGVLTLSRTARTYILTLLILFGAGLLGVISRAEAQASRLRGADGIMVAFKPSAPLALRASRVNRLGLTADPRSRSPHVARLRLTAQSRALGMTLPAALAELRKDPSVRIAEPDYPIHAEAIPNDLLFSQQWHLENRGQAGGTAGADVRATTAWNSTTGDISVIVGVIDTGVDYNHEDLRANILRGPGGIVVGFDFVNGDPDPMDDHVQGHGTHVAGIIGARGNNLLGVTGLCQSVRIMPIKILDSGGNGFTSDIIQAVDFAVANGAKVLNNSYGGSEYSVLVEEAIQRAANAGVLFVAAAGNSHANNDLNPVYPANHNATCANVISVGATTDRDGYAVVSNFGSKTVDIAAPGEAILSTLPGDTFGILTGTSMAAPLVSGAAALVHSRFPGIPLPQLKLRLLGTSNRLPALEGKVVNGRLDAAAAVEVDTIAPSTPGAFRASHRGETVVRLSWTAPGDDGGFGRAAAYELRYSPSPINVDNFANAFPAAGVQAPVPAGNTESFLLTGLEPGDAVYVGLRAIDNAGNKSALTVAGPVALLPDTGAVLLSDDAEGSVRFFGAGTWGLTTESASSGTHCYADSPGTSYPNNLDLPLTQSSPVMVTGVAPLLTFDARTDLEADRDFLHVEGTADGVRWHRLLSLTGVSAWSSRTIHLAAFRGSTIQLRFRLVTDGTVTRDGVWLDDIRIRSQGSGVCPFAETVEGGPQFAGEIPWAVSTEDRFSNTHGYADSPGAAYLPNQDLALTQVGAVSLTDTAGWLTFWARTNLETGFDYLRVEVSPDLGETWNPLLAVTGTRPAGFYSASLAAYLGRTVQVRFRLVTDGSGPGDGVWLDEIRICGEAIQPLAPPSAPAGVSAAARSDSLVELAWIDTSVEETGFRIERRSGSAEFAPIGTAAVDARGYEDATAQPSTTYTYRVRATNSAGDSAATPEQTVTTPAVPVGKLKVTRKVNFGAAKVGTSVNRTLQIRNLSKTETLRVIVTAPAAPFSLSGIPSLLLAPKESRSVFLSFNPQARGKAQAKVALQSSDPSQPLVNVTLAGTGK